MRMNQATEHQARDGSASQGGWQRLSSVSVARRRLVPKEVVAAEQPAEVLKHHERAQRDRRLQELRGELLTIPPCPPGMSPADQLRWRAFHRLSAIRGLLEGAQSERARFELVAAEWPAEQAPPPLASVMSLDQSTRGTPVEIRGEANGVRRQVWVLPTPGSVAYDAGETLLLSLEIAGEAMMRHLYGLDSETALGDWLLQLICRVEPHSRFACVNGGKRRLLRPEPGVPQCSFYEDLGLASIQLLDDLLSELATSAAKQPTSGVGPAHDAPAPEYALDISDPGGLVTCNGQPVVYPGSRGPRHLTAKQSGLRALVAVIHGHQCPQIPKSAFYDLQKAFRGIAPSALRFDSKTRRLSSKAIFGVSTRLLERIREASRK